MHKFGIISPCNYITGNIDDSGNERRPVRSNCATGRLSWEGRAPIYTDISLSTSRLDNGPPLAAAEVGTTVRKKGK